MNFMNTYEPESGREPVLRIWREINARQALEPDTTASQEESESESRPSAVN
jgi:hypothetical protein